MQIDSARRNNFDALRVAAALSVLVSHQHALSGLPEPSAFRVHSLGGLGVVVFFCISGFLVAQSWQADPHFGRFALRRLLRIWPGLAVVVLLSALVLGPLVSTLPPSEYFSDPNFTKYMGNLRFDLFDQLPLFFVGNVMPTAINGSLWTIPAELKCYLLLAVAGLTGLLRSRWLLVALLLAVLAIYLAPAPLADGWFSTNHWTHKRRLPLEFGLFFFAGTALHACRVHESRHRMRLALGVSWLLGLTALAASQPLLALWLTAPITVLAIGLASTPYLREAGRFGDLSYGLYIYAFPVQQTLIWAFRDRLPWTAILGLTLCTVFLLAFASWHLVEKRALRLKPGRRPTAPSLARPMALP